jgi:hypothetical protein
VTIPQDRRLSGDEHFVLAVSFDPKILRSEKDAVDVRRPETRTSMTAPVASGWSGRRVGLAPTGKCRLVTAHTQSGIS